jgi:hypothetical protein
VAVAEVAERLGTCLFVVALRGLAVAVAVAVEAATPQTLLVVQRVLRGALVGLLEVVVLTALLVVGVLVLRLTLTITAVMVEQVEVGEQPVLLAITLAHSLHVAALK